MIYLIASIVFVALLLLQYALAAPDLHKLKRNDKLSYIFIFVAQAWISGNLTYLFMFHIGYYFIVSIALAILSLVIIYLDKSKAPPKFIESLMMFFIMSFGSFLIFPMILSLVYFDANKSSEP